MNSLKTCTKCKEEKTASEFNRNGKNKDGLRVQCRAWLFAMNLSFVGDA